jgi:hypothetical protein
MTTDLDVRIAAALFDAAASTPSNDHALDEILRRAESGRTSGAGRRVALVAASTGVAAVGVTGIVILQPGRSEAPGTDEVTEVAATPTTLPTSGTVPGPIFYDDATLLSILYVNFDAGEAEDQSRIAGDVQMPEVDNAAMGQCMQDNGFQYFVPNPPPPRSETIATDPRFTLSPADFAAQHGLGIAAEALGLLPPEFEPSDDGAPEYYQSLDPDRREDYQRVLGECEAEFVDWSDVAMPDDAWVDAHDYAWEQFEPIVDNDDRVVDALATWQACMGAAGFDHDDPATIDDAFSTRVYDAGYSGDPVAEGSPEYAEIEQIMAEEITLATANAACVEPYTATVREVVLDRFGEYKAIFEAALEAGVELEGEGLS